MLWYSLNEVLKKMFRVVVLVVLWWFMGRCCLMSIL